MAMSGLEQCKAVRNAMRIAYIKASPYPTPQLLLRRKHVLAPWISLPEAPARSNTGSEKLFLPLPGIRME
jgi:hypothetical protein